MIVCALCVCPMQARLFLMILPKEGGYGEEEDGEGEEDEDGENEGGEGNVESEEGYEDEVLTWAFRTFFSRCCSLVSWAFSATESVGAAMCTSDAVPSPSNGFSGSLTVSNLVGMRLLTMIGFMSSARSGWSSFHSAKSCQVAARRSWSFSSAQQRSGAPAISVVSERVCVCVCTIVCAAVEEGFGK